MIHLELLAPARDSNIGIAAIDCGADAVYIAGPRFGARQAAGNEIEDIKRLCTYAHSYGVRIFVTLNTILYDDELEEAYRQMIQVQEAGADAIIVQDMAIVNMARNGLNGWKEELHIPLHASTQCAIRTPEQAAFLESLGFSRLILERELSLEQIRKIREAVSCELEFFVHGALCVCYSGQCYLSENLTGRSANRGACAQACRSRYDLADLSGKILLRDKSLLSLKDYNLKHRIQELAEAGITSFKIEGRLKNESYVKNVVRDYSIALDEFISNNPSEYGRASFGHVYGGFTPDTDKTFNRGYTPLFIDGGKDKWACLDAAKSMGEEIGIVSNICRSDNSITIKPKNNRLELNNGDGFSFVAKDGTVTGFRGDVCKGLTIISRTSQDIKPGTVIYRNCNAAFEKDIDRQRCNREISVGVNLKFSTSNEHIWHLSATAVTEDGRETIYETEIEASAAENSSRMRNVMEGQIGKSTGIYRFMLTEIICNGALPFMPASSLNNIRRELAATLEALPCKKREILNSDLKNTQIRRFPQKEISYKQNVANRLAKEVYIAAGVTSIEPAYELSHRDNLELMRTRYCIRYECGICPKYHNAKNAHPLLLINNNRRFLLKFDCGSCEMTVEDYND